MVTPRGYDDYFPGDQVKYSWNPGPRVVTVKIDSDYNTEQYNLIKAGVETWNDNTIPARTCSGVTFGNFATMAFPDKDAIPLYNSYTVYIINKPGGYAHMQNAVAPTLNRVTSARMQLSATRVSAKTVAHEIGHTFGVHNCNNLDCSSTSIMGPASNNIHAPSNCDVDKIKLIYCPTPTPTPTPEPTPPPMYGYCFQSDAGGCENWQAYCN